MGQKKKQRSIEYEAQERHRLIHEACTQIMRDYIDGKKTDFQDAENKCDEKK